METPPEEQQDDDCSSQTSDVSHISGLSDLSNHDWEPSSGTMSWVQQQMMQGTNPRSILTELVPDATQIPSHLDDVTLWKVVSNSCSPFFRLSTNFYKFLDHCKHRE